MQSAIGAFFHIYEGSDRLQVDTENDSSLLKGAPIDRNSSGETAALQNELKEKFAGWLADLFDKASADYYVAFARRCFNLIELLEGKPSTWPSVYSDNALLGSIGKIVEEYGSSGAFPSLCIIDDTMVYGRNIQGFLDKYRKAVLQCMQNKGLVNDENRGDVNNKLLASMTIRVFVANESYNFLRSSYSWVFESRSTLPLEKWRVDSRLFADMLWEGGVANTSHVLSCRLSSDECKHIGPAEGLWRRANADLRLSNGRQHDFYLFEPLSRRGIFPTVRTRLIKESSGERGFFLSPYCFFLDTISQKSADEMLNRVFIILGEEEPLLFKEAKGCESLYSVHAQLFNLVMSVITLAVFLRKCSNIDCFTEEKMEAVTDLSKMLRNFICEDPDAVQQADDRRRSQSLRSFLVKLWLYSWTEDELERIVGMGGEAGSLCSAPSSASPSKSVRADTVTLVRAVEDAAYQQAIESEQKASGLYTRKGFRNSDDVQRGQLSVRGASVFDFMRIALDDSEFDCANTDHMASFFSCLTLLMDSGEVSLRARYRNADENDNGQAGYASEVRATEMTLSLLPRRLGSYYEDFCEMADVFWVSDDFPEYIRNAFSRAGENDAVSEICYGGKYLTRDAEALASAVVSQRDIYHALLEWRNVFTGQK